MSRAQDLFDQLRKGGLAALDQLILDREPESLFLDFKGSPDKGGPTLHKDDNKNISKAISGFGNAEGGVLVWGVDCRRDDVTGAEVANKRPLNGIVAFQGKIEGAISRQSLPPHAGVLTHVIEEPTAPGDGYLVVLIPKSQAGPLRSTNTSQYHVRAGSNFEVIGHDVLAGMFGRAPQPRLEFNFVHMNSRFDDSKTWLWVDVMLVAVNTGATLVERPYLSIWVNDFPKEHFSWSVANAQRYTPHTGSLPSFSMVANDGVFIAPGAADDLCTIRVMIPVDHPRAVSIDLKLGGSGAAPISALVVAPADRFKHAVDVLRSGVGISSSSILDILA